MDKVAGPHPRACLQQWYCLAHSFAAPSPAVFLSPSPAEAIRFLVLAILVSSVAWPVPAR
jgi:hypothetical protein